jgi:hypothetical protein
VIDVDRKIRRRVDTITGTGHLATEDGKNLGATDYRIDRYREYIVLGHTGEELPGLWSLVVSLSDSDFDTFGLFLSNERVVLHLDDGRTLSGFVNGSEFVVGGPLLNSDGSKWE